MSVAREGILNNPIVISELRKAWNDSEAGEKVCHEEGGFIVRDEEGKLSVICWSSGQKDRTSIPPHSNCRINDLDIIATFHTHPNMSKEFIQEPSKADRLAVKNDPHLKGNFYMGEFVISYKKEQHKITRLIYKKI